MKITAIIPDEVLEGVKAWTGAKTLTEGLVMALREWIALKNILALNRKIAADPLRFEAGFTANKIRALNREP